MSESREETFPGEPLHEERARLAQIRADHEALLRGDRQHAFEIGSRVRAVTGWAWPGEIGIVRTQAIGRGYRTGDLVYGIEFPDVPHLVSLPERDLEGVE